MKRTTLTKEEITEELVLFENERASDHMASLYDGEHGYIRKNYLHRIICAELDYIFSSVPTNKDLTVLDGGCGTGYFSMICAEKGAAVEAVDISKKMLEVFQEKIASSPPEVAGRISIFRKELNAFLDEAPKKYDLIIFGSALHHLKDYETILLKSIDVLKPGGFVYIVNEPIGTHGLLDYPDMLLNKLFYNPKDIVRAIFRKFFNVELEHEKYNRIICDYHIFIEEGLNLKKMLKLFSEQNMQVQRVEEYAMSHWFIFYWLTQNLFKSGKNMVRIIANKEQLNA